MEKSVTDLFCIERYERKGKLSINVLIAFTYTHVIPRDLQVSVTSPFRILLEDLLQLRCKGLFFYNTMTVEHQLCHVKYSL